MPERAAIYARVSTKDQSTKNQLRELRKICSRHGWKIVGEYVDEGLSGAKDRDERPALRELMSGAMSKDFDRVVVWSVDRLGRSLKHLVVLLDDLHAKRINLYAHTQGIDTATPSGRMMWQFLSVFSEFEREMIRERVRAGLKRAVAEGKRLGRPRLSISVEQNILAMRSTGIGMVRIGRALSVGTSQVQRVIRDSAPLS